LRIWARTPITAILLLLGTLLSASFALAEDYSVDFGADTVRGRDAGTLHCRFGYICDAKMESLGLIVSVDTSRADPPSAHIRLNGGDPGCCYFAGAAGSMTIDPRKSLYRVPLFRGGPGPGGPCSSRTNVWARSISDSIFPEVASTSRSWRQLQALRYDCGCERDLDCG